MPRVISNPLLLSQILGSVIANAIEAMPTAGKLNIAARLDDAHQWLHLTIGDTGGGACRQQQMMAFKSFYTTRQGRLGIGFIMVKQIMESFGGDASLIIDEKTGHLRALEFQGPGQENPRTALILGGCTLQHEQDEQDDRRTEDQARTEMVSQPAIDIGQENQKPKQKQGGLKVELIAGLSPIPCGSEPARDGRQR